MQLFLWQPDLVGVAHFIMDCFDSVGAAPDVPDDASDASDSSSLGGWIGVTLSFTHSFIGCNQKDR